MGRTAHHGRFRRPRTGQPTSWDGRRRDNWKRGGGADMDGDHGGRHQAAECGDSGRALYAFFPPRPAGLTIPPQTQVHTSSTSYLTLLDSASSALIISLLSLQSLSPLSGSTTLTVPLSPPSPPTRITIDLPSRPVTMPMLQRLKRQFVQLHARTASRVEFGEGEIVRMFGQYLSEQLR